MTPAPRKRFGQHFLTAHEVIEQIVAAIAPQPTDIIVEIGPGRGAITDPLARSGANLHAVEFDRDLVESLRHRYATNDRVTIHQDDALRFDFATLGNNLRIAGNLPYNISTPLLFHLLQFPAHVQDAHFMLQKEVVDRMGAEPGGKQYGRLTIMLGCRMQVVPLFDVSPDAFSPPPKVMSSVVRLAPLAPKNIDIEDVGVLDRIVKTAFSQRRKTLRNALSGVADDSDFAALSLGAGDRPERIPISGWVALANRIGRRNQCDI